MQKRFVIVVFAMIILASCSKDSDPPYNANTKGDLTVEFDNIVGSSDLHLNTTGYVNSAGENFTVSKLKYYVSNFEFVKTDGSTYVVPQDSSYFLIDESDESSHEPLFHLPEGEYTAVKFIVGVDSIRSTMALDKRIGVLDPAGDNGDMYWGWNSGYIFFKMEGGSSALADEGVYAYHIGGFGGFDEPTLNNIKKIQLDLTERGTPKVKAGKETNIHLMVDIAKFFDGPSQISIVANPMVMFTEYSSVIANQFPGMFAHDHTEN